MRPHARTALYVAGIILAAGLGAGAVLYLNRPAPPASPAPPAAAAATTATRPAVVLASASTARDVADQLATAGLPMSNLATQDATSDPNGLLGRPGQYTSRASFDIPGGDPAGEPGGVARGGVVEVFATAADAKTRYDYIQAVTKGLPMLAEYDYLAGPVVLRITGRVDPGTAARFEPVLAAL